MKSKTAFFWILVLSLLGAVEAAKTTLEIGVMTPRDDRMSGAVTDILNGVQMSIDKSSAEFDGLGFQIKLRRYRESDSSSSAEDAAYSMLDTDKNVVALLGSVNSTMNISLAQILNKELGVVLATSTGNALTKGKFSNIVRLVSTDESLAKSAVDYLSDNLNVKKLAVIDFRTIEGREFLQIFTKYAAQKKIVVVKEISVGVDDNFDTKVIDLNGLGADAIFMYPYRYQDGLKMLKALQKAKINSVVMGNLNFGEPEFIKASYADAQSLYYVSSIAPIAGYANAKLFEQEYVRRFKSKPSGIALMNFDATQVILDAIKRSIAENKGKTPSRKAVMANLNSTKLYNMLSGNITFTKQGDRTKSTAFVM